MHPSSEQPDHAVDHPAGGASDRASEGSAAAALAALETLADRPLHEHAEVYEHVHARLQAALSEIDSA